MACHICLWLRFWPLNTLSVILTPFIILWHTFRPWTFQLTPHKFHFILTIWLSFPCLKKNLHCVMKKSSSLVSCSSPDSNSLAYFKSNLLWAKNKSYSVIVLHSFSQIQNHWFLLPGSFFFLFSGIFSAQTSCWLGLVLNIIDVLESSGWVTVGLFTVTTFTELLWLCVDSGGRCRGDHTILWALSKCHVLPELQSSCFLTALFVFLSKYLNKPSLIGKLKLFYFCFRLKISNSSRAQKQRTVLRHQCVLSGCLN